MSRAGPRAFPTPIKFMAEFEIDARILASSEPLVALKLCDARLAHDARWPWIVLLPRKPGVQEIEHLTSKDRALLMEEAVVAGAAVRAMGAALGRPVEKLNFGALGNLVPQLHAHMVGRRADDPAWPGPAWNLPGATAYSAAALAQAKAAALSVLSSMAVKA